MSNACCLIVTYNRKELLKRCIERCLAQDALPDVLVFDNQSTDGTKEYLAKNGLLDNDRVIYYLSDKNGGGSYGFSNGLRLCVEKGYNYIWLLDDDGYPETDDCLSLCIEAYKTHPNHIVNAFVHDGEYLTFTLQNCNFVKEFDEKTGNKKFIERCSAPFNGTLVGSDIVDKIGCPIAEFFVYGDEAEYIKRARKNGINDLTVRDAHYFHPRHISERRKIPILGQYVSDLPEWKIYCRARNYTYINKMYDGSVYKFWAKEIVKCFCQKEHRMKKLITAFSGFHDGLHEVFDLNRVMQHKK